MQEGQQLNYAAGLAAGAGCTPVQQQWPPRSISVTARRVSNGYIASTHGITFEELVFKTKQELFEWLETKI